VKVNGVVVACAWGVAVVLSYYGPGEFIATSTPQFEGVDTRLASWSKVYAFAIAVLVAIALTPLWARGIVGRDPHHPERRRTLIFAGTLVGGIAASAGAAAARLIGWITVSHPVILGKPVRRTAKAVDEAWRGARIESYRRLGRTGFDVSDISLGSGVIAASAQGEAIARAAIERGINYFDTAPDYADTGSEQILGRAMRGHRDRMFLATKFCTGAGHLPVGTSVADYIQTVEGSLQRLQTDYVDLVHIHACDSVGRLMDDNVHEAFDRLREQGKVRFLGFSSHTPNLIEVANRAIESDRFDVMMLAYHHGGWPTLPELIDRAAAADVGVVAMKTLKGAKHRRMKEFVGKTGAYSQAAFRWVLSNPSVSCLVVSFFNLQHVDEYIYASGKPLREQDVALLTEYDGAIAGTHCLPHCGVCLSSCPAGLPVNDVLRYRMYFEDYGIEKVAMQKYARLETQADVCIGCAAPCLGSCPVGLEIQSRTQDAHRMLTLG